MAKVRLNAAFKGFTNRIGNLVFYEWDGETIVRSAGRPRDPKTHMQLELREAFRKAVKSWQSLPDEEKEYWNRGRTGRRVKGYNAYISAYMLNRRDTLDKMDITHHRISGKVYEDTSDTVRPAAHTRGHNAPVPVPCPVVASSFQRYECLYPGILEL